MSCRDWGFRYRRSLRESNPLEFGFIICGFCGWLLRLVFRRGIQAGNQLLASHKLLFVFVFNPFFFFRLCNMFDLLSSNNCFYHTVKRTRPTSRWFPRGQRQTVFPLFARLLIASQKKITFLSSCLSFYAVREKKKTKHCCFACSASVTAECELSHWFCQGKTNRQRSETSITPATPGENKSIGI